MHSEHDPSVEAWAQLVAQTAALPTQIQAETLNLGSACGKKLAAPLIAKVAAPEFPMSAMDGFAVNTAKLLNAIQATGKVPQLRVIAEISAGHAPKSLESAQDLAATEVPCAQIMTGAQVPTEYDCVIPVENTNATFNAGGAETVSAVQLQQSLTELQQWLKSGKHIRPAGEEIAAGEELLAAGKTLNPATVGLALAAGVSQVQVQRNFRIAVITTGDELADVTQALNEPQSGTGRVFESNGEMLAGAIQALVPAEISLHRASDSPAELRELLTRLAAEQDLLITTGGVGSGAYDVVKAACSESSFAHVQLRPGGPQGVGKIMTKEQVSTPIIHLPGTPVGAFVGFYLFIKPLLLAGAACFEIPAANLQLSEPPRKAKAGATARPVRLRVGSIGNEKEKLSKGQNLAGEIFAREIPGSRLRPYAQANAIALSDPQQATVRIYPLTGE